MTAPAATATTPPAAIADYCAAPKALYAWNCAAGGERDGASTWWHLLHDTNGCAQRLVDFAGGHDVARVYLFAAAVQWHWRSDLADGRLPDEDALADVTTRLRAAGIEPWALWYLDDDPDRLIHHDRVPDLVSAVVAFNGRHPAGAFAGLHGDQEPNDPDVLDEYLAMNAAGDAAARAAGLGRGASLKPFWLTLRYDGAPFVDAALGGLGTGTLMDYTDDVSKAARQGDRFLAAADALGRRGEVALETGSTDPTPGVSFGPLVASDPGAWYRAVVDLDAGFRAHGSYDGVVIHDFAQYYAGLHGGVAPYDATGPEVGPCPEPVAETGGTGATAPTAATADTGATPGTTPSGSGSPAGTGGTGGSGAPAPPDRDQEPSGCGCDGAATGWGWGAILAGLGARRRGGRQARRTTL